MLNRPHLCSRTPHVPFSRDDAHYSPVIHLATLWLGPMTPSRVRSRVHAASTTGNITAPSCPRQFHPHRCGSYHRIPLQFILKPAKLMRLHPPRRTDATRPHRLHITLSHARAKIFIFPQTRFAAICYTRNKNRGHFRRTAKPSLHRTWYIRTRQTN